MDGITEAETAIVKMNTIKVIAIKYSYMLSSE